MISGVAGERLAQRRAAGRGPHAGGAGPGRGLHRGRRRRHRAEPAARPRPTSPPLSSTHRPGPLVRRPPGRRGAAGLPLRHAVRVGTLRLVLTPPTARLHAPDVCRGHVAARSVTRGSHVLQGAGGQPRRDRDPSLPSGVRAGGGDRRRLPPRGPQLRAPAEGRRGLRDRRARPSRARLPRPRGHRRHRRARRRRRGLPRLRLPLGEPAPGRGLRGRRASPSSGRAPTC